MKIIGFINQKGGVGKTTLILNTAYYLASQGKRVFLLDTDPQSSVCKFMEYREGKGIDVQIDYSSAQISALKTSLKHINDYDYLLIDTAGNANSEILKATEHMHNIIVPMQASLLDMNASASFLEAVNTFAPSSAKLKIVLNGINTNSRGVATDLKEYLKDQGIESFDNYICYRKPYKDSLYLGKSLVEFLSPEENALKEFTSFINEFQNWVEE